MSLLANLLHPSILLCLGIIIALVGALYYHLDTRMKEQNHKISAMLSLVSSLADEMNSVKYAISTRDQMCSRVGGGASRCERDEGIKLIDVSDGSVTDSELDSDLESESDSDEESIIELDSNEDIIDTVDSTIKILKLDIGAVLNNTEDEQSASSESDFSDDDESMSDDLEELSSEVSFNEVIPTTQIEMDKNENMNVDYKKMSVSMLRTIIKEKQLATDPSKLKKPELLKMLGC
jgi:hypothetical protein